MKKLEEARNQIDKIDKQIAELFEQRMKAVENVIEYKKETGMPILDTGREKQVIEKNTKYIKNQDLVEYYQEWQKHLMTLSKQYQAKILGKDTVAYQGVEGAFAHIALKNIFPKAKDKNYSTWKEVFEAVEKEEAAYGVLPIENSTTGDVGEVLDLCFTHNCYVTQIYDLPINQTLLGVKGARLQDIKTVYSHPQGLRQCAKFLEQMKIDTIEYPNTAMAAKHVAQEQNKTLGAIASQETAQIYDLEVLIPQVNNKENNTTRFIVISKNISTTGNRFSLLFTVDHSAGQLAKVVKKIGELNFNMECIKSRPLPNTPWEYYFYVELVGDVQSENSKNLINSLEEICNKVKKLGVYTKEEKHGA